MSAPEPPQATPEPEQPLGLAARLQLQHRAGGVVTALFTTILAFVMGGLVVLVVSGKNPLGTYKEIFNGSGLNWFGSYCDSCTSANNLQQTLIQFTVLLLTGLAVAFAFRCGLFNIGGQGQYIVGTLVAVQIGTSFQSLPTVLHILFAIIAATLAGAIWGGIAGILKATVGAHEVISTIMLNWIAVYVGSYLIGFGGPMQDPAAGPVPVTKEVVAGAKLPIVWGNPLLQALHIGLFVALAALVVYWIVLSRTTLGYEVRAVGFNPDAARYGGINVSRSYFLAMAISGGFAGLAGSMDILGWQHRLDLSAVQAYSAIAFIGIAVALLGRNAAVGVFFAALLFAGLKTGTSTRNLNPDVFRPELANNLTQIIQGLVVLFVGADLLIVYLWNMRRRVRRPQRKGTSL
jgi:simple sugar transport system permease protein